MKRNAFITTALEELQQEISAADDKADATTTEVTFDQSLDAVAALMEKNTELAAENIELQEESFDNDTDVIDSASDSVSEDLEEAVAAGAALEELHYLAELTVKTGQANKANAASLAFALEQITDRAGLPSVMSALEDDSDNEPAEQVKNIGGRAREIAGKVATAVAEVAKRIWQWVMNFFTGLFTNTDKIAEKAKALRGRVKEINDAAVINDDDFIKSLRIPESTGSVVDCYRDFDNFARSSIRFFDDRFVDTLKKKPTSISDSASWIEAAKPQFAEISKALFSNTPQANTVPDLPQDGVAAVTPLLPGGVQLYMAYSEKESKVLFGRTTGLKIREEESIPALTAKEAETFLGSVEDWLGSFKKLKASLNQLKTVTIFDTSKVKLNDSQFKSHSQVFIKMLTGLATSTLPHTLNLCIFNSKRLIAYTEKSIEASKITFSKKDKTPLLTA